MGSISSVSVNIKQIIGVSLSAAIKNDATHGKIKVYAFYNVSESPFSFSVGFCFAFYNRSVSPSVYLVGIQSGKIEAETLAVP